MNDLLRGHVQFGFYSVAIGLPYVKSGRLRALATTGSTRLPFLPEVPSASEVLPGYDVVNWYGMVLPAGTKLEIVNRLNTEIVKAMKVPEIATKLVAQGSDPVGSTPQEFGAFIKSQSAKWARVVKEANVRIE
jgi:tripartite-type tricarboxylate transporter receptor subunit TctC